ncbi:MAG: hypothetical protein Q8Q09_26885 [Deltaproteobacteria bacterium]|nr:hypothetical protein [Deltaproteobacteria bacterium]
MNTLELFGDNALSPPYLSALVVTTLHVLLLLTWLFCLRENRRALHAADRADAQVDPKAPLTEHAQFVVGVVELAANETHALRVTIDQLGEDIPGKTPTHQWTENDRVTDARPFYLKHASGERIRIEPHVSHKIVLVDKLDQTEWTVPHFRRKRAELTKGETVYAEGSLTRGHDPEAHQSNAYRGAGSGWTLTPKDNTFHFSTEPLGQRHRLRARAFARAIRLFPLVALLALAPLSTYYARLINGQDVQAEYTGQRFWTTRGKNNSITEHFAVGVSYTEAQGQVFAQDLDIDRSDYFLLPESSGFPGRVTMDSEGAHRVWVRFVPAFPRASVLGRGATVYLFPSLASLLVSLCAMGWIYRIHGHRRWYERPLNEQGKDSLPKPSGEVFASDRK